MGDPVEAVENPAVEDLRPAYDAMREQCPVARDRDSWVVLGHAEVVAAATDPRTFSSRVAARRAIPNSLDGAEHSAYRRVVDRYLTAARVAREEAQCRWHAATLVDALPRGETVKLIAWLGVPYAVRTQSTWLGWPSVLEEELVGWMRDNYAATRSRDRTRTAEVAERFDAIIRGLLDDRREGQVRDVTAELMRETVDGRRLTDDEVVSILRNWTAGDLGSLAACVGVVVHHLASTPSVQEHLRDLVAAGDATATEAAVEEILRIDDPFVSNRRVTTRAVELGGAELDDGARVTLNWTAANRDPRVFGDPDRFDPAGNAPRNLVFGVGPHVCPGRALTLMELRVVVEELLGRTSWLEPATDRPSVREVPPLGGWARVPVILC
jgi:cytochrome P450